MGDTRTLPIIWTTLGWWTLNQDGTWTVTDDLEVHKNKNTSTDEKIVIKSCSRYMYFSADCDKKSNSPSNHLVIRLTRQHQIITGTLEENRAGFISLWQLWKRPVAVTEGKLIQGRHLVVKNDTKSISTKVNSPHLSLLSLYILTSLSVPPRVTVPSSWDVSRGRRKRHEEREAKATGI